MSLGYGILTLREFNSAVDALASTGVVFENPLDSRRLFSIREGGGNGKTVARYHWCWSLSHCGWHRSWRLRGVASPLAMRAGLPKDELRAQQ